MCFHSFWIRDTSRTVSFYLEWTYFLFLLTCLQESKGVQEKKGVFKLEFLLNRTYTKLKTTFISTNLNEIKFPRNSLHLLTAEKNRGEFKSCADWPPVSKCQTVTGKCVRVFYACFGWSLRTDVFVARRLQEELLRLAEASSVLIQTETIRNINKNK